MDTTDTREAILSKIRKNRPESTELPVIPVFDIPGKELPNFTCHLKGFDGDFHLASNRSEAVEWIKSKLPSGKKIFSAADGVEGNVTIADFTKPADMNVIDVCVAEAILGVGETGSLLVDRKSLGDPAAALFSTDLYLLIDRDKIHKGLQEAYDAVNLGDMQYSSFFTGPSATADIEAVHITGAQGEISLTAVIYNCSEDDEKDVADMTARLPQGTPLGQPDAPVRKFMRDTDLDKGSDSV